MSEISDRTKAEIKWCQEYLKGDGEDKEGAVRGLNDWFYQSLVEEGHLPRATPRPKPDSD